VTPELSAEVVELTRLGGRKARADVLLQQVGVVVKSGTLSEIHDPRAFVSEVVDGRDEDVGENAGVQRVDSINLGSAFGEASRDLSRKGLLDVDRGASNLREGEEVKSRFDDTERRT
jgi:hypothetical protein